MPKPDKIDLILQLILDICIFVTMKTLRGYVWISSTPFLHIRGGGGGVDVEMDTVRGDN